MIRSAIFTLTTAILLSGIASAQNVPTAETRAKTSGMVRLPGWQDIEIVRNGEASQIYSSQIPGIIVGDYQWLKVANLDIWVSEIEVAKTQAVIPFYVDLRHQKTGVAGIVSNGTVNIKGNIYVLIENNQIKDLIVDKIADSQQIEAMVRGNFNKAMSKEYVASIVKPILVRYFEKPEASKAILSLLPKKEVLP